MSNDHRNSSNAPRLARLALTVPDAGSSGLIDVTDLRAEPPPLSLAASLVAAPRRAAGRTPWTMLALGSALALSISFASVAAALRLGPSVASDDSHANGGQLSQHEAAIDRGMLALSPAPIEARSRAPAPARSDGDHDAGEDLASVAAAVEADAPAVAEPISAAAPPAEPAPAKRRAKTKTKAKAKTAASSTAAPKPSKASPKPSTKDSVSVECVLDPARCDLGSSAKASSPASSARPAPRPEKLSISQLKAALATTKADARRCGPEHGADAERTVRVKLSIEGATGSVSSATAQGDDANTSVGVCVARALGQTQFPPFSAKGMGTIYSVRL